MDKENLLQRQVGETDGHTQLTVYDENHLLDIAVPLHRACLQTLQDVLQRKLLSDADRAINPHVLYTTLLSHTNRLTKSREEPEKLFNLRYDSIPIMGEHGDNPQLLINPLHNAAFEAYFESLPLMSGSGDEMGALPVLHDGNYDLIRSSDRFFALPAELIYLIMTRMDPESIEKFQMASPAAAHLKLTGGFWKRKLLVDMPWMHHPCAIAPNLKGRNTDIDWKRIYLDMEKNSEIGEHTLRSHIGIVHRRRVWEVCEEIASTFQTHFQSHQNDESTSMVSLRAIPTPMRPLSWSSTPILRTDTLVLVSGFASLGQIQRNLYTFWSQEGFLTGFGISEKREHSMDQITKTGNISHLDVCLDAEIVPDDWVKEFILYSRQHNEDREREIIGVEIFFFSGASSLHGSANGDLQSFRGTGDCLIAGIQMQISSDRQPSALSLLLAPGSEASAHAGKLGKHQQSLFGPRLDPSHDYAGLFLWKKCLPPSDMHISSSWANTDLEIEKVATELLMFGQNDEELADIVSIAGDDQLQGFEIQYSQKPPRSIGHVSSCKKTFLISGNEGERIINIASYKDLITFQTNRERCLHFGDPESAQYLFWERFRCLDSGDDSILGIHASWKKSSFGESGPELIAFGVLSR